MDKRRSKGVTVLSVLIIIGSLISLIGFFFFNSLCQADTSAFIRPAVFYISIITAFFLLRLKDWARIVIVIMSLLLALETLAAVRDLTDNIERGLCDQQPICGAKDVQQPEYGCAMSTEVGAKASEATASALVFPFSFIIGKALQVYVILAVGLSILFNLLVVFFFTRPHVKAQFRQ